MLSSQVLAKGDASAILDPELLTIRRDQTITRIPLAAVQEVHARGDKALEVVLTDRAVHRIEGGNAFATTLFLTALNDALPAERDPAGSALVTTEDSGFGIKMWQAWTGGTAIVGAYVGYVWWTTSAHGGEMGAAAFFGLLALLVGLLITLVFVWSVQDKVLLARRGVTVVATRAYYPNGKKARHYTFTDTSGNEYQQDAPNRMTETIHVVYDPEKPHRHAARETVFMIVLKHVFGGAVAFAILGLGLWGVLAPYI